MSKVFWDANDAIEIANQVIFRVDGCGLVWRGEGDGSIDLCEES